MLEVIIITFIKELNLILFYMAFIVLQLFLSPLSFMLIHILYITATFGLSLLFY